MDENIKDKYIKMLLNKSISMNDIEKNMEKHIPDKLYRYRSFNEHWKSDLFDGNIYLSKPSEFNDPFDGVPRIDIPEFWEKVGRRMLFKSSGIDLSLDGSIKEKKLIEQCIAEFTQDSMRVACFSEKWDSLLMWAHYASSYKGFCIEYDTKKIPSNIRRFLLPVIYQSSIYDSTNDFTGRQYNSFNFLFFKSLEWEYENEWRIAVYQKQVKREINFKDYISEVILGVKCDDIYINEISKWAKDNKVALYKSKISYDEYAIQKERII